MALVSRLLARQNHFLKLQLHPQCSALAMVRPITMKVQKAAPPTIEGHDEKNMRLGRPQSPHLTIYAPQVTSMLSISHRATGMMLAGYTVLFANAALFYDVPCIIENLDVSSFTLGTIKTFLAFPICYHFWNGIRHLIWDTGKCLGLREVYLTGYLMLTATILSTIALVCM